jgi:hypothetical protein
MKRIFTLLFAVGTFTAAVAQPGNRDNRQPDQRNNPQTDQRNNPQIDQRNTDNGRDIVINHNPYDNRNDGRFDNDRNPVSVNISFDDDDYYGNSRFANERKKDMLIAKINREYDYRIQRVRNSFFLDRWEKMQKIRFLQEQRQQEIRMVYMKFSKRNHHDRRYDNPGRRY